MNIKTSDVIKLIKEDLEDWKYIRERLVAKACDGEDTTIESTHWKEVFSKADDKIYELRELLTKYTKGKK